MTLKIVWWCSLGIAVASLVYNVTVSWRLRRLGSALPAYFVGNISGGVGLILLNIYGLLGGHGALAIAAMAGSMMLLVYSIVRSMSALRRRS